MHRISTAALLGLMTLSLALPAGAQERHDHAQDHGRDHDRHDDRRGDHHDYYGNYYYGNRTPNYAYAPPPVYYPVSPPPPVVDFVFPLSIR